MAKDISRPGSDESKEGSYRVPSPNKGRENDDEIIAMKNAIEERIRELDALGLSNRESNLPGSTGNANSKLTSDRGRDSLSPSVWEASQSPRAIEERFREIDAHKPSDRESNLTSKTDKINSQLTSVRGRDSSKPSAWEVSQSLRAVQASPQKKDNTGCIATLVLFSVLIALVFPPFWLVILLFILNLFKSA